MLYMAAIVLSLANLCESDFLEHESKPLRNILKRIEHNIDPDEMFRNVLWILFIVTFCFQSLKYQFSEVAVSKLSPSAYSLAMSKSCGMQSL